MLLVIFIKKRLRPNFTDVRTASVGAGIMGIMVIIVVRHVSTPELTVMRQGNKGATAIRVSFAPTPSPPANAGSENKTTGFVFVNAHLAAFDEMFEKRNSDFHDLCKRLVFDLPSSAEDVLSTGSWYTPAAMPLSIFDTDALFWLVSTL